MDTVRNYFKATPPYQPIDSDNSDYREEIDDEDTPANSELGEPESTFSWIEYGVVLLLGVAMLWAWNMFMAAAPYFHDRFKTDKWILNHFQPAEVSVSTVTNLGITLLLSKLQENASYPRRIILALIISSVSFVLLTASTSFQTSATVYFAFLMVVIAFSSLGTGLIQNGAFAFVSGFGDGKYIQAIMAGQGIAGVLPPLVQIISVAVVNKERNSQDTGDDSVGQSPKSAFIYFLTAVGVSLVALGAFLYLLQRTSRREATGRALKTTTNQEGVGDTLTQETSIVDGSRISVPLLTLFKKLRFLSVALVICFTVTMVFPVFTTSITSTSNIDSAIFIPLAFLMWNVGDLSGRVISAAPQISLTHYPFALFCLAMARLLFIPLYFLCNIKGRGAIINSDLFYLVIVQLLFGLSNGYLGSQCMMGAGDWVLPQEREAAGGFMSLMLIGGLATGSLLSFLLGNI